MKIALIGFGKMGKEVESLAISKTHEIVAKCHTSALPTQELFKDCDVVIDFSTPHSVVDHIRMVMSAKKPMVVGTTGWYDQLPQVRDFVDNQDGALIYASNFSVGVQMFYALTAAASKLADKFPDYDAFIQEIHHVQKKDSPSGTALSLGNIVLKHLKRKKKIMTDSILGTIESDSLHIASTRSGSVPGTHIVGFDSAADTIELKHTARNRAGFAAGALHAAEWIVKHKGVHDFSELFPAP